MLHPTRWHGGRSKRRRSPSSNCWRAMFTAACRAVSATCAPVSLSRSTTFRPKRCSTIWAESEFDLLGLFQGVGLPFRAESDPIQMPNMIWLYRRPILDYWAEHDETLGAIVKHVLV